MSVIVEAPPIRYRSSGRTFRVEGGRSDPWEIDVGDVRVVGEVTYPTGGWADDWKFCLVTADSSWVELSMAVPEANDALDWLEVQLGAPMDLGLGNSVKLASRILWPPELAGRPLFEFRHPPPTTPVGRLLRRIGYRPAAMSQSLSLDVEAWLRR